MAATIQHCEYCFDVLIGHLENTPTPEPKFKDAEYPLFVTWNIVDEGKAYLRGCIGTFTPLPLVDGLKQYTLKSAFEDRRFKPINAREVRRLSCSVSLLIDFEKASAFDDWDIGTHGIWIEFIDDNNRVRTATFLPEVMSEHGWTHVEAIDSLLRKGGFRGHIDDSVRKSIKLTRYKSSKAKLTFDEYKRGISA